jgi:hypothetical protein
VALPVTHENWYGRLCEPTGLCFYSKLPFELLWRAILTTFFLFSEKQPQRRWHWRLATDNWRLFLHVESEEDDVTFLNLVFFALETQ